MLNSRHKRIIKNLPKYLLNDIKKYCLFLKIISIKILSKFTKTNKGVNWLILERGFDAQDNAWHFFKYVVNSHPEINIKFAIKKNSKDYKNNLKGFENKTLEYNSFKYYIFLFSSQVIISTHLNTFTPSLYVSTLLNKTKFRYQGKIVFLQHGIIHQEMDGLKYPKSNPDLFISGAKNEYELLLKNFNYPKGVIQYTGLARFDNLITFNTQKYILIMPTWRFKYSGFSENQFLKSEFYKNYKKLLTDKNLMSALKKKNYKILFYNHFEFQKYNNAFNSFNSDRVEIIQFGNKSVQKLLKESELLITDFSSVYYDFIYMRKPVIFFTFDEIEFRKNQYGKEYDKTSEFGIVEREVQGVLKQIIKYLEGDQLSSVLAYRKSDEIFKYRDGKNCERIFSKIQDLLIKKNNPR